MKKRIYWKTVWNTMLHSKGRFLSIMLLMFLGSFTFVGLKVTKPNMQNWPLTICRLTRRLIYL